MTAARTLWGWRWSILVALLSVGSNACAEGDGKPLSPSIEPVFSVVPQPALRSGISGVVRIAPALATRVEPGDTLFIFARSTDGARATLVELRKPARDLPTTFFLDDSIQINSTRRLSTENEVVVGARISRMGKPIAAAGDLQGFSTPVRNGSAGVVVIIDSEVR